MQKAKKTARVALTEPNIAPVKVGALTISVGSIKALLVGDVPMTAAFFRVIPKDNLPSGGKFVGQVVAPTPKDQEGCADAFLNEETGEMRPHAHVLWEHNGELGCTCMSYDDAYELKLDLLYLSI
jgi:hypothetical protein